MTLNSIGLVTALSTFLSIWFGHVAVRRIEWASPTIWLPALLFASVGFGFEVFSLFTSSKLAAVISGIVGMTLLWDALEFVRQQNRIKKGQAPANLNNPRHLNLLKQYATVTPLDLLKREPIGRVVSEKEAVQLMLEKQSS